MNQIHTQATEHSSRILKLEGRVKHLSEQVSNIIVNQKVKFDAKFEELKAQVTVLQFKVE